jgi:hypothetical protein
MLTYFLITWVVAFFVFCIPLLFITAKEKEVMKKTESENWEEFRKKKLSKKDLLSMSDFEEFDKEYKRLTRKRKYTLFLTSMLNIIFLIMLHYVIAVDFNISFYNIAMVYSIIFLLAFVPPIVSSFFINSNQNFFNSNPVNFAYIGMIILFFITNSLKNFISGPGEYLVNLAIK